MPDLRRFATLLFASSLVLVSCGGDEKRTISINANAIVGSSAADVTYTVNGETTAAQVTGSDGLEVEVEVNGEVDIVVSVTNSDDVGAVSCQISGITVGAGANAATDSATCNVTGTIRTGVSAVSVDNEGTDRPGEAVLSEKLIASLPADLMDVSRSGGRTTFEGDGPGELWVEDVKADGRADTPAEFAELFGGEDVEAATLGEHDGALASFDFRELSFVTIIDDDWFVFTSAVRSDDLRLDRLTALLESIES